MSFDVIYRFSFPFVQLQDLCEMELEGSGSEWGSKLARAQVCSFFVLFACYADLLFFCLLCLFAFLSSPSCAFCLFYFCFILVFVAYFAFWNRCFLLSPKHIIINICVLYIFPIEHLQQQVVGRRLFQVWLKWSRREGCSRKKKIIIWKIIYSKGDYGRPTRGVLVQKDCKEERAYRERQGRFL